MNHSTPTTGGGSAGQPTCFVLMGFGQKVDYRTNRTLDLDKTYKIIRRAVDEAGLTCIRADDIVHSGVIDRPMYEQLLLADVAIADLSTSNENAIYELGVRHALKPRTTIIIAEKQFKFPFDLGHVVIRPYEHLGTGIDFDEADRLRQELVTAILAIMPGTDPDSPVYTFLPGLTPPLISTSVPAAVHATRHRESASQPTVGAADSGGADATFSVLLDTYRDARRAGDFASARALIDRLRRLKPTVHEPMSNDPYLVQQHAFATYMAKQPTNHDALLEARRILLALDPENSGDPETLGLWGAIHKRLWDETKDRAALEEGILAYARGFYLKRDYYNGINYAFLLDERARVQTEPDEQTADRVLARRTRIRVLAISEATLKAMPRDKDGRVQDPVEQYWLLATRLEAMKGLADPRFEETRAALFECAPEPWMNATTDRQIAKLADLLGVVFPPAASTSW